MELGLIIKITNNGEQEIFAVNKNDQWQKFASDSRSIIEKINGFDKSGKFVIIVKFLSQSGYLIGLIKARKGDSGRSGDNTTAWIHVPAKMIISGKELEGVIEAVKQELSATMGINESYLKAVFSKSYEEKNIIFSALTFIRSKKSGSIGWRVYGYGTDYQLSELIGNDAIEQIYYGDYEFVCFIDKSSALSISAPAGVKITQKVEKVKKIPALCVTHGFKPYLKIYSEDRPFEERSFEIPANALLAIAWKRNGYREIVKPINSPLFSQSEVKYILKRDAIRITNMRGEPLSGATIVINGKQFNDSEVDIPETEISRGVKFSVSLEGYARYEEMHYDLSKINIKLKDEEFCKTFKLRKEDGVDLDSDASVEVKMKNKYPKMPFKGYVEENGYLLYNGTILKIKWFAAGVAFCALIGLLYLGYVKVDNLLDNWFSNTKQEVTLEERSDSIPPGVAQANQDAEDVSNKEQKVQLIKYLSENAKWNKDSLAQYDQTKTLFDKMNNYKFDSIIALFDSDPELKEIQNVKDLITAVNKAKSDGKNFSNTYRPKGDDITITGYIDKITKTSEPNNSKNIKENKNDVTPSDKDKDKKNQRQGRGELK